MNKEYQTYHHAKTHIRYHLIFSTKYRKPCLEGIEEEMKQCFADIAKVSHFRVLNVGIDRNHVHLFVRSCPTYSIYQIVRRLKQMSTRMMWLTCGEHLSKYYYKKRKLWSGGYFCSTVGAMSEDTVIKYIKEQG